MRLALLFPLALACSDYGFQAATEEAGARPRPDTGEGGASAEPGDTAGDTGAPEEDPLYCTAFDDFADWNQSGEGAWRVEEGMLVEGRYGEYDAIAWLHDLGSAEHFGVQVDIAWTGNANDLSGVVWGFDGETGLAVRWDDPQDHYERYEPPGGMDLAECTGSSCTPLLADASAEMLHAADKSFATLLAEVDGDKLRVRIDDEVVMEGRHDALEGSGPGVVGLFSDDNDGGVWFDNFCVWIYD